MKKWEDSDSNPLTENLPDKITLVLYEKGTNQEKAREEVRPDADGNWKYTFTELNPEKEYYVEEVSVEGYTVSYTNDAGNPAQPGATIVVTNCKNAPGYELPATGSTGTAPYTTAGAVLMGAALVGGYRRKRRQERASDPPAPAGGAQITTRSTDFGIAWKQKEANWKWIYFTRRR